MTDAYGIWIEPVVVYLCSVACGPAHRGTQCHSAWRLMWKIDGAGNETICIRRQLLCQPLCTFSYTLFMQHLFPPPDFSLFLISSNLIPPASLSVRACTFYFFNWWDFDALIKDETLNQRNKFTSLIASFFLFKKMLSFLNSSVIPFEDTRSAFIVTKHWRYSAFRLILGLLPFLFSYFVMLKS